MPDETLTGAQLLAKIKPVKRERGAKICLRPDLLDAWADLDEQLTGSRVEDASKDRLGKGADSKRTRDLAARVQELEAEIEASEVRFLFRAMSKDAWNLLKEKNPPRPDNKWDQITGFDRDAVEEAQVRECLVDPVFQDCADPDCTHEPDPETGDTCGSWQAFELICNPSEWAELRQTANSVNGVVTEAPKSMQASEVLARAGSASRRRARGA